MLTDPLPNSGSLERYEALPTILQLRSYLSEIQAEPTEWISVLRNRGSGIKYSSLQPLLVATSDQRKFLATTDWSINDLGEPSYSSDRLPAFRDGLTSNPDGYDLHLFVNVSWVPSATTEPVIEFTPSFVWWLGLITRSNETMYRTNHAGRDEEVVEIVRPNPGEYEVRVNARHLRKYLAARSMSLVIQHAHSRADDSVHEARIDLEIRTKDAAFAYTAWDAYRGPGFVAQLVGKQAVLPFASAGEHPDDLQRPERFQSFIVDIDPSTGDEVRLSCERDEANYLTPVFFDTDVLTRYRDNPDRYTVLRTDVSCHGRWAIDVDINGANLVQVWLGHLIRLPETEREHWLTHNVPPNGGITITRSVRDLAGQWVEDERPDPARLRRAKAELIEAFTGYFGESLYKQLGPADLRAFDALALCTNPTEGQRDNGVMVLSKGIVDALDVKTLRESSGADTNSPSLACLQLLVENLGADPNGLVGPLRQLQGIRSAGSAHMKGTKFTTALSAAGLNSLQPDKQFETIVDRVTMALQGLSELFRRTPPQV
ncbi:hypothetical protein CH278_00155 [Rhodococcus sp. 05-2254-5]|uniref:hypothetical protein n=1 Tax=Nocardiaceae TaxID=85025 RepID=UPI00068C0C1E|nr:MULTISPECIES: hypothetical protein [Rhodococcus]OZE97085.1 hypothetical protein CH300_26455 [Rhodococcus sp. 15-1154-1]OZE28985.1 hypothetical protein CH256_15595 [Rhodococcus sp. 05-2254-6]OZE39688.1 hypothetical protein CH278_00155 [Rhodococcus sp. 05-2254-5]OZE60823.1 hypothetical protein CH269_04105 [Rhodococcus sp. 05-2254-1]OZE97735.1 hypothetical protein CH302_12985 [Rhodococcus sp. 15-2388-1-1a]